MASFTSTATSTTWPRQMCACAYGQCVVKISRSNKNPGRSHFACSCPMASNAWWDKMESVCAKVRTKTLDHRELMKTVFTGAAVMSKNHWTPGEKCNELTAISSDSIESIGLQPFVDPIPACVANVEVDLSVGPVDTREKRKRTPLTSYAKSKKVTSGVSIIAESMNNLTNVVQSQNQQVIVRHFTGNESLFTISKCMQRLKSIPFLLGMPLFHFASTLMDNADY